MSQPNFQPKNLHLPEAFSMSVAIKRTNASVIICLSCAGEYQAIELFDRLVNSAENGEIKIELKRSAA